MGVAVSGSVTLIALRMYRMGFRIKFGEGREFDCEEESTVEQQAHHKESDESQDEDTRS